MNLKVHTLEPKGSMLQESCDLFRWAYVCSLEMFWVIERTEILGNVLEG